MHKAFAMAVSLMLIPVVARAHEGDRKERDRKGPYRGPGIQGRAIKPDAGGSVGVFDASGVSLLSWCSLTDLPTGSSSGSDIWGYTAPSGREYALMGMSRGVAFVDVTDPVNPTIAGTIAGPQSVWRDMKTYEEYAYIVCDVTASPGIQVVDLSDIDNDNVVLVREATNHGMNRAHNVAVDPVSKRLYATGTNIGMVIWDLTDPSNPIYLRQWTYFYVHDAIPITYDSGPWSGRQIVFCASPNPGLLILDATDPLNIPTLGSLDYVTFEYTHHSWVNESRTRLFLNDEQDEPALPTTTTYLVDIEDLTSPTLLGSFTNGNTAIDHNPMGKGDFLYEANYTSGLRIYYIADLDNIVEAGWFDTHPESDAATYNGAWGVYTDLPSGVVLVSDLERGLFVLDVSAVTNSAPPAHWMRYK